MAKQKGSSEIRLHPRTTSKHERGVREVANAHPSKHERDEREVENARRLDKLPLDVWDMILDHLESDDLFPLALSCRYFRQKQKELVAQARQEGRQSDEVRYAFKTTLCEWPLNPQPASADYLRFCDKEKDFYDQQNVYYLKDVAARRRQKKSLYIRCLAAYHGYLPLLQELLNPSYMPAECITKAAGESSSSQSLLLLVLASDLFLAFSSSQRAEANWKH